MTDKKDTEKQKIKELKIRTKICEKIRLFFSDKLVYDEYINLLQSVFVSAISHFDYDLKTYNSDEAINFFKSVDIVSYEKLEEFLKNVDD